MGAEFIQANYEELEAIAARFGHYADSNAEMSGRVRQGVEKLRHGDWIGQGSTAFFNEMSREVLPALDRLTQALQQSREVTRQISVIWQQAEEEAAAPFRQGAGAAAGVTSQPLSPDGAAPNGSSTPAAPGQTPDTVHPIPTAPGQGTIWDHFRAKGKIWEYDAKPGHGKFDPGIKLTVGIEESSVWGSPKGDSAAAIGGYVEAGARVNKDGIMIGAGGEFYVVKGDWDTAFVGNKEYGVTGGIGFKGLSADAFGGIQFDGKDKKIGAEVGVNLISVEGSVGANVAGVNVSATGEVGLKAELGFEVGRKGVQIKLPFISFGLKFGGGVD